MKEWWRLSVDDAARELASDPRQGLTPEEAAGRLKSHGPNELAEKKGRGPLLIFLDQFKGLLIWVLVAAALVSGFLKEWVDALAILAIVVLNAVLGLAQEFRAEKSLAALKKMSAPLAKVIRSGVLSVIPARELVPGDLVELEAGDHVPADGRVVSHTAGFMVQEASLTGESIPVPKTSAVLDQPELQVGERKNLLHLGTSVVSGKGRALVARTGMQTEIGRIAGLIQEIKKETTPLQKKLEEFGRLLILVCFVLVGLVFAVELLRGGKLFDMFLTSVSLAVAAIPEGLPAVVTIALALGVQRMVRRHVLIRKLASVETLGCATVICSDKTGTITQNEMTVRAVWTVGHEFKVTGVGYEPSGDFMLGDRAVNPRDFPDLVKTLSIGVLCNNAHLLHEDGRLTTTGDPTEIALLTAAAKAGVDRENEESVFELVEEVPFDSDRKKMSAVRKAEDGYYAFSKGAPDVLLADCTHIYENGRERPIEEEDRRRVHEATDRLSGQALRVLGTAFRVFEDRPGELTPEAVESGLTFVGLVAMIDPPRPEVKAAVEKCRRSGIRAVMITGDHKNTAVAVARESGFFELAVGVVSGEELDRLPDEELDRVVADTSVYARVSPEHKLRVVRSWRRRGGVVAMTGDGVNDAPAVKEADIGVAMGITGTDVTKEVSDMVITDDNFASIVAAVEEGRGIYDNIRKFIHYLLSCNIGEILVMFVSALAGFPVPLLPIQILWVNLITDGLPALALGVDPVDANIMDRPPRKAGEPVVSKTRAGLILWQGLLVAACTLAAFLFVLLWEKEGLERARTVALATLTCSQLFHAFNCRSMKKSLFKIGLFTNVKLFYATGLSFVLQLGIIFIPFLQPVFKTRPLSFVDVGVIFAFSSLPFWGMEAVKVVNRKLRLYDLY